MLLINVLQILLCILINQQCESLNIQLLKFTIQDFISELCRMAAILSFFLLRRLLQSMRNAFQNIVCVT